MTAVAETRPEAKAKYPYRLFLWQIVFGIAAPITLIALNLAWFGGVLVKIAPAAMWVLAIGGPILLISSQRAKSVFVSGALVACALFAFVIGAVPLAFLLPLAGGALDDPMTFVSWLVIAAALMAPVFLCAFAYWRQARRRQTRWGDFLRPVCIAGAGLACALVAVVEVGDRAYFSARLGDVASPNPDRVIAGLRSLRLYPFRLMARENDVCAALYQSDGSMYEFRDFGVRTPEVRKEVLATFGGDALDPCHIVMPD